MHSLIVHQPISCYADQSLHEVLQSMQQHQIGSMVIVDADQAPLGIFTLRDLRRVLAADPDNLFAPIGDLMVAEPLTLPPVLAPLTLPC
ncbi:CBS domain-containing protein [Paenalcaligenes hominis]|uniref:CBS domain-containing protein n=1 Tax=Paenalcaligenes hominis TaxID=643674 RepID=UPI003613BCE2